MPSVPIFLGFTAEELVTRLKPIVRDKYGDSWQEPMSVALRRYFVELEGMNQDDANRHVERLVDLLQD